MLVHMLMTFTHDCACDIFTSVLYDILIYYQQGNQEFLWGEGGDAKAWTKYEDFFFHLALWHLVSRGPEEREGGWHHLEGAGKGWVGPPAPYPVGCATVYNSFQWAKNDAQRQTEALQPRIQREGGEGRTFECPRVGNREGAWRKKLCGWVEVEVDCHNHLVPVERQEPAASQADILTRRVSLIGAPCIFCKTCFFLFYFSFLWLLWFAAEEGCEKRQNSFVTWTKESTVILLIAY